MKRLRVCIPALLVALVIALVTCGCAGLAGSGATPISGASGTPNATAAPGASEAAGTSSATASDATPGAIAGAGSDAASSAGVSEGGAYTDKDSVALYIHLYGHLPHNFISKTKARKAGWVSAKGNLDDVLSGKSIGGSEYYNDDGQLPDASGRRWTECDIGYEGGFRGSERIVFSNDGLVYYTPDHYATFERLY